MNIETTNNATPMAPLLRSVATEIVERTLEVSKLEFRLPRARDAAARSRIEAALANHRRELRLAREELAALGWERDDKLPLCFLRTGADGRTETRWKLEDTGFYRSLTSA